MLTNSYRYEYESGKPSQGSTTISKNDHPVFLSQKSIAMFKDYETRCLLGSSKKVTARLTHIQGSLLHEFNFSGPPSFYVSRNRFVNLFPVFPNLFVRARIPLRASLAIIWFSTQSTTVFVQSLNLSVIPRRLKFAGHPEHGVASSSLIFSVISLERTRPMGGGVR